MSFQVQSSLNHDSAAVKRTICDEDFVTHMAERFDGSVHSFSSAGNANNPKIHTTLLVPTSNFPETVQKFLPNPLSVTMKIQFTGNEADVELNPAKVPADVKMQLTLTDSDSGCDAVVEGVVNCTIPFVGNKVAAGVESALPAVLKKALEAVDAAAN
ncbi:DUF2505 domain-containing protein [Micrococcoides hystricis]|uniref:DUF2505 domain-containing protein n=1 Tax=Micrococcoides hystricis TaxID=1572761 RepID=A0ABV6PAB6_9MICC